MKINSTILRRGLATLLAAAVVGAWLTSASLSGAATQTLNDATVGAGLNQFSYTGSGWSTSTGMPSLYQGNDHFTNASGAAYSVKFKGTRGLIFSEKNNTLAIFAVSIDGGTETLVDPYATTRQDQQLVYSSPTLSAGTHTIKVRSTGTKNAASNGVNLEADRLDVVSGLTAPTPAPTSTATSTPTPTPTPTATPTPAPPPTSLGAIKTVFVVMMENTDWKDVKANGSYPYLNSVLLPSSAYAENYSTTYGHPSLPNYIALEAGDSMGLTDGTFLPPTPSTSMTDHLVTQLRTAGISWRYYAENLPGDGTTCNISDPGTPYSLDHNAFVYFDDVRNDAGYCQSHERPYSEFAGDLTNNTVPAYNFIVPNDWDQGEKLASGSNCMPCQADSFLKSEIPKIQASAAYQNGGAILILWDEMGWDGNYPSGLIVNSPYGKTNYSNTIAYNHGSTLRTVQEIFGVGPLLRQASTATDLSDLFTIPLTAK
ncbi:alkaline phosphatase family protein [Pseudarthrobacter sp. AL07]|uniref:alkaline phosphatase family protein n=1 Tax=unclassified Pseudarthrobacter TaxID=2647000 RepID=UPI002499C9F8|nr:MULTISPECIES: alkaline phosphatase family protein [unclassified Pseudarthrobacter]MDI3193950.1 alkaline phosphatase family protein [Pseudarthrobacter sp. AL20]MDI3208089.1 alkaline phosphatase family protein [Pseudarthrobacter sp. AL07]